MVPSTSAITDATRAITTVLRSEVMISWSVNNSRYQRVENPAQTERDLEALKL